MHNAASSQAQLKVRAAAKSLPVRRRPIVSAGSRSSVLTRRATRISPHELLHSDSTNSVCSGHPDAIKRRLAAEQWQKQRAAERLVQSTLGGKWHEAPSALVLCSSADEYRRLVQQSAREGRLLVAKFFTEECYVCKSLFPKIRKIAADNPDVMWCKLNGSDPALVSLFHSLNITKVPLFHMVRDGQLVSELPASLSPDKLHKFRAELAAHKPATPVCTSSSSTSSDAAASEAPAPAPSPAPLIQVFEPATVGVMLP